MSNDQQYLLNLALPISFQEEDYLVTNSNYLAWNFIKRWPNWGQERMSNIAYVYGETGAGKSHLASIWQGISGARLVSAELLSSGDFKDEHFLVDNLEALLSQEHELFNLFNHVLETKKSLLITARQALSKLNIGLPDLRSRLASLVSIELSRPDDRMIEAIITKYFSDAQITLNAAVIKFLIVRMDRSYSEIFKTLKALDTISLSEKKKISIPFIKKLYRL